MLGGRQGDTMAAPRRIEDIMLQKDGKFFVAGHRGLVGSAICRACVVPGMRICAFAATRS